MIVTVYGDELAAGSHARFPFAWASDDNWNHVRRNQAHPDNIPSSFGFKVSRLLHMGFHSGVERDQTLDSIAEDFENREKTTPGENIVLACWGNEQLSNLEQIDRFGADLENRNIPHVFINSKIRFPQIRGRWLWNTQEQDFLSWATTRGLIKGSHPTSLAHTLLANMILHHLTKQLSPVILVE
jgi:hypothetical protein